MYRLMDNDGNQFDTDLLSTAKAHATGTDPIIWYYQPEPWRDDGKQWVVVDGHVKPGEKRKKEG